MNTNERRPDGDMHLGIDIGGTAIKAVPVDTRSGQLAGELLRILG